MFVLNCTLSIVDVLRPPRTTTRHACGDCTHTHTHTQLNVVGLLLTAHNAHPHSPTHTEPTHTHSQSSRHARAACTALFEISRPTERAASVSLVFIATHRWSIKTYAKRVRAHRDVRKATRTTPNRSEREKFARSAPKERRAVR